VLFWFNFFKMFPIVLVSYQQHHSQQSYFPQFALAGVNNNKKKARGS
jgi:hypothetical protein